MVQERIRTLRYLAIVACCALGLATIVATGGESDSDEQYQSDTSPPTTEGDDPGPWLDDGGIGDPAFTVTWSHTETDEGPDIDMWVLDPKVQLLSSSRDGYSLGPTPEGGSIDQDDQGETGPGDGGGPERAYWPQGGAPEGAYTYGVRYYTGAGTAYYTFRVYEGGVLTAEKQGTLSTSDERHVLGAACNVQAFKDLCDLYNANMVKFKFCYDLALAEITRSAPPQMDPAAARQYLYQLLQDNNYIVVDEGALIPESYDPFHDANLQDGDIIMFYTGDPPNDPRNAPHYAVVRGGKVWSILHWEKGGQLDGPRDLAFFGKDRMLYDPYKGESKYATNPYIYFVCYAKVTY